MHSLLPQVENWRRWELSYNKFTIIGSDFNFDFNVSFTEEQQRQGIDYNYTVEPPMETKGHGAKIPSRSTPDGANMPSASTGTDAATYTRERPGMSAFALEDGIVYHTYSAYSRGVDGIWGLYPWLDRAPRDGMRQAIGFIFMTSIVRNRL